MTIEPLDIESILRRGPGEADHDPSAAAERLAERAAAEGLLDVAYATLETPLGTATLAATDRGLVRVGLPNRSVEQVLEDLAAHVSPRVLEWPRRLDRARRELDEYFEGRRRQFDLELDWQLVHGSFARRVLEVTARVPCGRTITYAQAASEAGSVHAHRAAGNALGANPIPIVVPCHRVVRTGGALGSYGGGVPMKEYLLRLEGALAG